MESDGALRIGVAGAGATGGYLAARLARAGYPVTLLARPQSAEALATHGLRVEEADGTSFRAHPEAVVTAETAHSPVDVVLFSVKAYDTEQAAADIAPLVGDSGSVVCLQNGVANEEVLAERYGPARVLSGVLYVGAERLAVGSIRCRTPARVFLGPLRPDAGVGERLGDRLVQALSRAGVETAWDERIRAAKWQKFLFNCGLNPTTALTGATLGAVMRQPAGRRLVEDLVREALDVAMAAGAPLGADAFEDVMRTAERMDISSSMAEDLAAGRPLELDAFGGYVLRLAEARGIDVPATRAVTALLRVMTVDASHPRRPSITAGP